MNPADLTLNISPTLTSKTLPTPQSSAQKLGGRAPVPRVDVEPIYTQLKSALGPDGWATYKAAVNAFVLGEYTVPA
jgi:transcriptional coactivator HFI1/ADA1